MSKDQFWNEIEDELNYHLEQAFNNARLMHEFPHIVNWKFPTFQDWLMWYRDQPEGYKPMRSPNKSEEIILDPESYLNTVHGWLGIDDIINRSKLIDLMKEYTEYIEQNQSRNEEHT